MENKFIVKFSQNKADLQKIVELANSIDEENIDEVKETHKKIRKVVNGIKKEGKSYRDEANKFNKAVLTEEKEYLAILDPVDEKLKKIIDDEKQREIIEARKELLPQKRKQLELLEHFSKNTVVTDEQILRMDDAVWVDFYQRALQDDADQKIAEKDKEEFEANREEREAKIAEDARLKGIEDERKRKEDLDELARQKEVDDANAEAQRKAKLMADEKYQNFLTENNFDSSIHQIRHSENKIEIIKVIATLNL